MKLEPMYDRILILPLEGQREISGVILPDADKVDCRFGVVVSVGEGYVSDSGEVRPLRLRPKDQVMFPPYAGIPIQIDGTEFLVLREGEVQGKIILEVIPEQA